MTTPDTTPPRPDAPESAPSRPTSRNGNWPLGQILATPVRPLWDGQSPAAPAPARDSEASAPPHAQTPSADETASAPEAATASPSAATHPTEPPAATAAPAAAPEPPRLRLLRPLNAGAGRTAPPASVPPPRPVSETLVVEPDRWSVRGAVGMGSFGLVVLFGGFLGWASLSQISGAVVATGQVEVEQHRQVVQHPDGGVVDEILVRDGQKVEAGAPLIRLDGRLLKTELAIVEGQYFEILARRGRLEAERDEHTEISFPELLTSDAKDNPDLTSVMTGQQSLFLARRDTLAKSLDQLTKQADQIRLQTEGVDAQIAGAKSQRGLIDRELTDQRSLFEKGLAQATRVLALEREAANLDGRLGELTASRAQGEARLTEIGINKLRLTAERRETAETELRDLSYRELELAERRRALTEQISRLEIRAPVSGIVHQMQVTTPRSVLRAADPVMFLIPQDRPLVIAARIAPINVDEVHIGQKVALRFSAFSSRTTPEIDGVLEQVSADAVLDQATQTQFYRAEVTIPPDQRAKMGDLALLPGMPVEVYIQTGKRTPLAYLLKPLSDYFVRAFRET